MALEVAVAMFLWMKKKTHPERSAGKDVGLQTVNSNPMLEKIRSVGKNLTGKSAAWDWFFDLIQVFTAQLSRESPLGAKCRESKPAS